MCRNVQSVQNLVDFSNAWKVNFYLIGLVCNGPRIKNSLGSWTIRFVKHWVLQSEATREGLVTCNIMVYNWFIEIKESDIRPHFLIKFFPFCLKFEEIFSEAALLALRILLTINIADS